MTHGSLFSGIGGFDLAAEWMGWENEFHCEWNEFGQKVLKHYWPNAESFNDISKTDFTPYANRIDILTGGFPCQPYSLAGKRKGKEDERHLWPQMLRAIREIRPRWVVGENVFGLINWAEGLVFHEVQTDLEDAGYEVWPYVLPAVSVNAPHRRDRVWFVAYRYTQQRERTERGFQREFIDGSTQTNPNTNSNGQYRSNSKHEIITSERGINAQHHSEQMGGDASHTNGIRGGENERGRNRESDEFNKDGKAGSILHTNSTSKQRQHIRPEGEREFNRSDSRVEFNNWQQFPTQSPICFGDDGLPSESLRQRLRECSMGILSEEDINKILSNAYSKWRNETIKAAGNAIVPQVALQIFKAIEEYEQNH